MASLENLPTEATRSLLLAHIGSGVANHIEPVWGHRAVASVHPAEVQDWVNKLDRAPSTVHRAFHLLRSLSDDAVRLRQMRTNPCVGVQLPSRQKSKNTTLTPGQVSLLIEQTNRYKSLVAFLAYTGARWGEAAALTVADIDLKNNEQQSPNQPPP